jgi:tetratricopeptide (TPR) repeat protein
MQAGIAAEKQGRLTEAIAEFRKATEAAPTLAPAFTNLGAAYMQAHDYGSAIAPLKRALQLDPSLAGPPRMLGYALLLQGNPSEALPYLEKSHLQDALGIALVELGRYQEAITNLSAALAKHPNDPDLLYYLGRAAGLLSKGALDNLEGTFPNSARAHQSLAENYAVLRRVPEAEKEYEEALRLAPDARGIHLELGQLYAASGDWAKAEEQFEAESKLQPDDAETAFRLGNAELEQGKLTLAQRELERANQLRPRMPETLYSLGKAASLAGDASGAEKAWTELLAIEQRSDLSAQAHFGLAGLYRKAGRQADAEREMDAYRTLHSSATSQK